MASTISPLPTGTGTRILRRHCARRPAGKVDKLNQITELGATDHQPGRRFIVELILLSILRRAATAWWSACRDWPRRCSRRRAAALDLNSAHPVHAGPDAQRHHRHGILQEDPETRPALRVHQVRSSPTSPGRRDQPHAAEDPGRTARGDAGTPRHGAGRPTRSDRSTSSRRRTRSSRRARIRCPKRSSTGSCSTSSWTTCRKRRGRGRQDDDRRGQGIASSAPVTGDDLARSSGSCNTCRWPSRSCDTR